MTAFAIWNYSTEKAFRTKALKRENIFILTEFMCSLAHFLYMFYLMKYLNYLVQRLAGFNFHVWVNCICIFCHPGLIFFGHDLKTNSFTKIFSLNMQQPCSQWSIHYVSVLFKVIALVALENCRNNFVYCGRKKNKICTSEFAYWSISLIVR